jgi:hypothetical protein
MLSTKVVENLLGKCCSCAGPTPNMRATQAQSWMGWEMAVGFRRLNQLQVWDGRRWSQEEMPGGRRASPPRGRPRSAAAALGRTPTSGSNGAAGTSSPAVQSNGVSPNGSSVGPQPSSSAHGGNSGSEGSQSLPGSSDSGGRSAAGEARRQPWEATPIAPAQPRPVARAKPGAAAASPGAAGAQAGTAVLSADGGRQPDGGVGAAKAEAEVPAMVAQPLLECHYSLHGAFLSEPLLEVRAAAAVGCPIDATLPGSRMQYHRRENPSIHHREHCRQDSQAGSASCGAALYIVTCPPILTSV